MYFIFGKIFPLKPDLHGNYLNLTRAGFFWCTQGLYRQALWMKLYGHACLKRTLLWSTSPMISMMDLGKIQKKKHRSLITTARKYLDKDGRKRYHGTRALKRTEFLH